MKKEIIVTGGRNYKDHIMMDEVLSIINPDVIIQGGATGADLLASDWALENHKTCITFEADWETHGKAAGPIRNKQMLFEYRDAIVIAFPGGKGTKNCVETAVGMNMIVLEVK